MFTQLQPRAEQAHLHIGFAQTERVSSFLHRHSLHIAQQEYAVPRNQDVVENHQGVHLFEPAAQWMIRRRLAVIERLARDSRSWLRRGGYLVLEITEKEGPAIGGLLESFGYVDVSISQDLAGRDRIAEGRRP